MRAAGVQAIVTELPGQDHVSDCSDDDRLGEALRAALDAATDRESQARPNDAIGAAERDIRRHGPRMKLRAWAALLADARAATRPPAGQAAASFPRPTAAPSLSVGRTAPAAPSIAESSVATQPPGSSQVRVDGESNPSPEVPAASAVLLRAVEEIISPPDRIKRALHNIAMTKAAMAKADEDYQHATIETAAMREATAAVAAKAGEDYQHANIETSAMKDATAAKAEADRK